ncbi:hypothetical protein KAJ89_04665 [Candidatus Parcubacteria bacterium]|nr:hypothetical protein [Candidatus Parcubacteria bacterium]
MRDKITSTLTKGSGFFKNHWKLILFLGAIFALIVLAQFSTVAVLAPFRIIPWPVWAIAVIVFVAFVNKDFLRNRRTGIIIIGLCLGIILVLGFFRVGTISAFIYFYPELADRLIAVGVIPWVAKTISAISFIPIFLGIWLIFSFNRVKRYSGIAILFLVFVSYNIGIAYISGDQYFDASGKASKCYAQDFSGKYIESPCGSKFHPTYGTEVKPITKAVARSLEAQDKGPIQYASTRLNQSSVFFDPVTGKPMVWYSFNINSELETFEGPGFNGSSGEAHKPVTKEIVKKYFSYQQAKVKSLSKGSRSDTNTSSGTSRTPPVGSGLVELRDYLSNVLEKGDLK